MKICIDCKEEKPMKDYMKQGLYWNPRCNECRLRKQREYWNKRKKKGIKIW